MAENVGGIFYTVDADAAPLLKSTQAVDQQLDRLQSSMAQTDKSAKVMQTSMSKTAVAVKQAGSSMGNLRGVAQGLGYQMQDIAVQLQMGTNAFMVLGQQGSQIASLFGPGGAVAGAILAVGSALLGAFVPSLMESSEEAKKLLIETRNLAEEMDQLTSAQIAWVQLNTEQKISELNQQLTLAAAKVETYRVNLERTPGSKKAEEWTKEMIRQEAEVDAINQELERQRELLGSLDAALSRVTDGYNAMRNSATISNLTQALREKADTLGYTDRQLALYVATLNGATKSEKDFINEQYDKIEAFNSSEEAMERAEQSSRAYAQAQQSVKNQLANMSDQLEVAKLAAADMEVEAAQLAATQRLGATATAEQVEQAKAYAAELVRVRQAARDAAEAERTRTDFQNLQGELNPLERIAQEEQAKLDLIDQYRQMNLDSQINFKALEDQVVMQSEEKRRQAMEQTFRKQSELNEFVMGTFEALGSAGTNAISGLLTGTMSAQDALRSLASTVLNEAVGALVQMGIQYVKNQMIEKAAAASSVATAATTGGAIAASYAPAAAAASVATLGTAATVGLTALASAVPAMIGLVAGGRQYGGPVSAGSMYRINENGAPEIYQAANGRQYMLPNTRGEVISNRDATGGGGAQVSVIVNNNAGADIQTTSSDDGRTIEIAVNRAVNEVAGQISGNRGPVWSAMKNSTNVNGRTR